MSSRTRFRGGAALLALAVTACTDSTSPPTQGTFDAAKTDAAVQAMSAVFVAGPWMSFETLGGQFGFGPTTAPVPMPTPSAREPAAEGIQDRVIGVAHEILAASRGPSSAPVIAPDARGTTFVLDPTDLRYIPDPTRDGAPDNGIRYILYAVNPITRQPLLDVEIGHADVIDLDHESPNGIALQFLVVSGDVTYVDYTVTADGTDVSGTLSLAGFVTDGTTTVDFEIAAAATHGAEGEQVDIDFEFEVVERQFRVIGEIDGAGPAERGTVSLTVQHGDTTIEFTVTGDEATVDATFRVNGSLFATISGDPRNPDITGADGRELTPEERRALSGLMGLVDGALNMFHGLMRPVQQIIMLAMLPGLDGQSGIDGSSLRVAG